MDVILVTGGAGFIGTNFIRFLFEKTEFSGRIVNFDKLGYSGNQDNLKNIEEKFPDRYHFVRGDICNRSELETVFNHFPIDTIVHFAAESHVDRSIHQPASFVETNVLGTYHLLESAKALKSRLKLFHHVSTDEVYGCALEQGAFHEKTPYAPSSPYSASKAASDHLVRAFFRTYGLPVTISNCSNNYGPYQYPEKLIPLIILRALENQSLPIYGDGQNVRDWLFVEDHCRAVWEIMQRGVRGETYNIGGDCPMANLDIVGKICDCLEEFVPKNGRSGFRDLISLVPDRPGHDRSYIMNASKIKKELGWKSMTDIDAGVRQTVKWYLTNLHWINAVKKSGDFAGWMQNQYRPVNEAIVS